MLDTPGVETIARAVLLLSSEFFIVFVFTVGFLGINKKIFGRAFLLMAFTLILNRYLKSLWQIPLPPELNKEGWAFPSGHMQSAVALWGYITWEYNKKWTLAILVPFWALTGFALVHLGYHYPRDVYAATGFGLASIAAYRYLSRLHLFQSNPPLIGILLSIIGALLITLIPNGINMATPILGEAILLGFSLGWLLSNKKLNESPITTPERFINIFIASIGIFFAYQGLFLISKTYSLALSNFAFGFFICFWVAGITPIVSKKLLSS